MWFREKHESASHPDSGTNRYRAARKPRQETGVTLAQLEQVRAYALTDVTEGQCIASVAYYALLNLAHYAPAADRTHLAQWVPVAHLPALPFDHELKVQHTWQRLQEAARSQPIPFYLLPPKFSLNQLQRFYEALYQVPLDNRISRKWVKARPYIEALQEVEANVSHRPSQLPGRRLRRLPQRGPAKPLLRWETATS